MNEDNELSKIYVGLNGANLYWAKLVSPRLMESLCDMDDIVTTGDHGGNITFTLDEIHKKTGLKSVSPVTFEWVAKQFLKLIEPLIDIDDRDNVTLTEKGRKWCRVKKGA